MDLINTESYDERQKPNHQFKDYRDGFNNLLKIQTVEIPDIGGNQPNIVNCMITNDSETAITIIKTSDREYWVLMFDLTSYQRVFYEQIGGEPDSYIKLKEVQQNNKGDKYALVYYDDCKFRLRYFTKKIRNPDFINRMEVDINKQLNLPE